MNDLDALIDQARQQGWAVERRRSGHLMFRPTDRTIAPIVTASTPSDWRGPLNLRSQLRRAGLDLPRTS